MRKWFIFIYLSFWVSFSSGASILIYKIDNGSLIVFDSLKEKNKKHIIAKAEQRFNISISKQSNSKPYEILKSLDSLNNYILNSDTLASLYYFILCKSSLNSDGFLSEYISAELFFRLNDDPLRVVSYLNYLYLKNESVYISTSDLLLNYLYREYEDNPRDAISFLYSKEDEINKDSFKKVFADLRKKYTDLING